MKKIIDVGNDWTKSKKQKSGLQNPADPLGYTSEEISAICKRAKINIEKFNKAFGVNTCAIGKDGKSRFYRCDVERALFTLNHKDGIYHEWD